MNKQITHLNDNELFAPIDRHIADHILELSGTMEMESEVHLAAALVSRSTRNGNICLDLNTVARDPEFDRAKHNGSIVFPDTRQWIDSLSACNGIGNPGDETPLILDSQNRLYFYRYWEYEKNIADTISQRIGSHVENVDYQKVKESINRIFDSEDNSKINMQKIAVMSSFLKKFSVISGGPGTGKTTTVAKIIALLVEQADDSNIKINLCAPTGKAAARLSDTVRFAKSTIHCDDTVKNTMPDEAVTIHRLLKKISGSPFFRHNKNNPLQTDAVIIDEASMIDVALMAKLFNAIPKDARIILVGDKDQLSSVEAGSALGDICNREAGNGMSKKAADEIQRFLSTNDDSIPGGILSRKRMQEHIIVLDKNYRFDEQSGIGGLSRTVNKGDVNASIGLLMDSSDTGVEFKETYDRKALYQALRKKVVQGYSKYLTTDDSYHAVNLFNQFKILCAVRSGPFGVDAINQFVQTILHKEGLIDVDEKEPDQIYKGRPILITRNDYSLGLFNGDTGIIMPDPGTGNGELYSFFPITMNEIKKVPIHRLPEHETVYAMTIHKSQGSEFKDVSIILPDKYYPILTRELIYTGITRAINTLTIWGKKGVLKEAIENKIERTSGLRDALWGN